MQDLISKHDHSHISKHNDEEAKDYGEVEEPVLHQIDALTARAQDEAFLSSPQQRNRHELESRGWRSGIDTERREVQKKRRRRWGRDLRREKRGFIRACWMTRRTKRRNIKPASMKYALLYTAEVCACVRAACVGNFE